MFGTGTQSHRTEQSQGHSRQPLLAKIRSGGPHRSHTLCTSLLPLPAIRYIRYHCGVPGRHTVLGTHRCDVSAAGTASGVGSAEGVHGWPTGCVCHDTSEEIAQGRKEDDTSGRIQGIGRQGGRATGWARDQGWMPYVRRPASRGRGTKVDRGVQEAERSLTTACTLHRRVISPYCAPNHAIGTGPCVGGGRRPLAESHRDSINSPAPYVCYINVSARLLRATGH